MVDDSRPSVIEMETLSNGAQATGTPEVSNPAPDDDMSVKLWFLNFLKFVLLVTLPFTFSTIDSLELCKILNANNLSISHVENTVKLTLVLVMVIEFLFFFWVCTTGRSADNNKDECVTLKTEAKMWRLVMKVLLIADAILNFQLVLFFNGLATNPGFFDIWSLLFSLHCVPILVPMSHYCALCIANCYIRDYERKDMV